MSSDTEVAKIQLREHLSTLLVPRVGEGFWSIYDNAKSLCERNQQIDQILRTFQNMLTKIPEWSEPTLTEEVERILKISKCTYMDDLLMGVFLSYMKSFASLHYRGSSGSLKVEFERPNITKFIHELYKHSARKLWQVAYLFKTVGVTSEQQARNRQEIEMVVYKCMDDVIRAFLPWDIIAKSYFVEPSEEEKPAPPPVSKSVLFEDLPDEESESSSDEEEEESKPELVMGEDADDKLSITELDEQAPAEEETKEEVVIETFEPTEEDKTLVLNM